MIEIFKTNVDRTASQELLSQLKLQFPSCKINFDLDDCDRILRMEGPDFCKEMVVKILERNNHTCEVFP